MRRLQSANWKNAELVTFKSYLNSLLKIQQSFGEVFNIQYVTEDRWDFENKGDHLLIHNKVCLCHSDSEYQSVFGSAVALNGVHHWKLKIIQVGFNLLWNTMIGVVQIRKGSDNKSK